MITKSEAFELVERLLSKIEFGDKYIIDEKNTVEYDWGWVVNYNSQKYLQTDDAQFALMGNGPFLVYRESGKIKSVASSEDVAEHIDSWLPIEVGKNDNSA